jgi:integrase
MSTPIRRICSGCCARAASGHVTTEPTTLMKSRRRITALRLSEGLNSEIDKLRIEESYLYISRTKNSEPRGVFLPKPAIEALRFHPRGLNAPGQRIFKFHKGGHIYSLLRAAAAKAGVDLPERQAFHIFCHTYGTLMRRYGKLDLRGLVGTGRWKDIKSTLRYPHAIASEEAQRANFLPTIKLPRKFVENVAECS